MITKKVIRTTAVMLSEESVSNRLDKARGFSSINQLQNLIMVSKSALNFNLHERLHTEGSTNRGNVIGPLDMDPLDDHKTTWRMKVGDKFTLREGMGQRSQRVARASLSPMICRM